MKRIEIYDPAMCCSTGVCGPSIDQELLRISTVLNKLANNLDSGVKVDRYNLTNNPQAFVDNKVINEILNKEGADILPVTIVDDKIVKTKSYPTNDELSKWLNLSEGYLNL